MYSYLLPFSVVWMLVAALLGLRLGIRSLSFAPQVEEIAKKGELAAYHAATRSFNWSKLVHAHTFLFAVVGVVIFVALGHSALGELAKDIVATGVMVASVAWTLAALREFRPIMGLADFVLLISIAISAYGVVTARFLAILP